MIASPRLRIARPVSDLPSAAEMYRRGLGLEVLGSFEDHAGFDGMMLGVPGASWHFELTRCQTHPVAPTPTAEDLVVFYIPKMDEWTAACASMLAAGFEQVASFNPYWDRLGRTYEDADGYRFVLQRETWSDTGSPVGLRRHTLTSSDAAPASARAS